MNPFRGQPTLGVFGGSFDPPHVGHALLPVLLRSKRLVDRVLVAPCADHPLGKTMSPFADRLAWTRVAMRPHGDFVEVSDVERELAERDGGPSHTLRLLEEVARRNPSVRVRLVIGSDIVQRGETARWHRWDRIEAAFDPLVVPRAGFAGPDACMLPEVSSTQIRDAIEAADWDAVGQRVPAAVVDAMRARGSLGEIWLFGRGHVAAHAEPWLRARGFEVRALPGRDPSPPAGSPVGAWVLVRDPGIAGVAAGLRGRLPPGTPVLHAAGALQAAVALAPLREAGHPVATLHPICALRRERPWPARLWDASFGVEGDDPAVELAQTMIGPQPRLRLDHLDAAGRRAYHAACALAANHLSVLMGAAGDVLTQQGQRPDAVAASLGTLLHSALDNLLALGLPAGVTGPVARGDLATVRGHLQALPAEAAELYRILSHRLESIVGEGDD